MVAIAVRGTALTTKTRTAARIVPVATKPRAPAAPPPPVIVPAGGRLTSPAIVPLRPTATARPMVSRRVLSWRVLGPGRVRGLSGLEGLGEDVIPSVSNLETMLVAGNYFLDAAIDAARPFFGWGFGGAILAYDRGLRPEDLWGAELAREFAKIALKLGGLLYLRKELAEERASWIIVGDRMAVARTVDIPATSAYPSSMGWVPDSYVTGRPMAHGEHATQLDSIGFGAGALALTSVIAGTEAAVAAAVESGAATRAEAEAEIATKVPAAIRGAGGVTTAAASGGAARGIAGLTKNLVEFAARTNAVKWTAAAFAATQVDDAINAFRSANVRATEAATGAAGALLKHGIDTNNPEEVREALKSLGLFQKQSESNVALWAAGGFVASEILRRR